MSVRARVIGGTPRFNERSKCETCVFGHIVEGQSANDRIVRCGAVYPELLVRFHVTQCSGYIEKAKQTYEEMKKSAWVIMPNKGGKMGFLHPHQVVWNRSTNEPEEK